MQASGSIYRICMPPPDQYNGNLIIWAHGFQDAGTPVQIPEDQLEIGDVSLPGIINAMGFGFATNSYSKTGLAIRQGMADIVDLVDLYSAEQGAPNNVYLTGASEGGIITALLLEGRPDLFSGGVAACGPVGDFPYQINYFGDGRATFEVFFPGLIPGDPWNPSAELAAGWFDFYEQTVRPVVFDPKNRARLDQWARVAKLPFDRDNYLETLEVSVADVLRYSVVNLNDAAQTLGGFPFDNRDRWYFGSSSDLLLNIFVPRRSADPVAIQEMRTFYNTSGRLENPLITLHTLRDQQVPYLHEFFYTLKTLARGNYLSKHLNIPIDRFEHCNFEAEEAVLALGLMLLAAGDFESISGIASQIDSPAMGRLEQLADDNGLRYDGEHDRLEVRPPE